MANRPIKQSYKPREPLGEKQEVFLRTVVELGCELSKRESYVVNAVLECKTYHENHQYHLNKIRKKYSHLMATN